jgi:hypothetical protein
LRRLGVVAMVELGLGRKRQMVKIEARC